LPIPFPTCNVPPAGWCQRGLRSLIPTCNVPPAGWCQRGLRSLIPHRSSLFTLFNDRTAGTGHARAARRSEAPSRLWMPLIPRLSVLMAAAWPFPSRSPQTVSGSIFRSPNDWGAQPSFEFSLPGTSTRDVRAFCRGRSENSYCAPSLPAPGRARTKSAHWSGTTLYDVLPHTIPRNHLRQVQHNFLAHVSAGGPGQA